MKKYKRRRCSTHTHTAKRGHKLRSRTMKWKWGWREMKMRWKWGWNGSYLTDLNRNPRRGTQKKGEEEPRENTNTNTPGPERANPEKAREKKNGGRRKNGPRPADGGEGRKHLNMPEQTYPSENKAYLSTHGPRPTWNGGARMKKGSKGKTQNHGGIQFQNAEFARCSHYRTVVGQPRGACNGFQIFTEWVHNWFTSPDTKETIPAGRGHACCLLTCCFAVTVTWASREKRRFCTAASCVNQKGIEARTAAHSSTLRPTVWNPRKGWWMLVVSLYVDELLD